jgi:HPt (histidine-containing phosphotransfer) domain-containing protein
MSATQALIEPVIDRQALDRHTMGNAALQQELFVLFFDQMPVYVDQLEEALNSGDADSWRMGAHGIKGSSRALGFARLASLSRDCEIAGPDADNLQLLRDLIEETRLSVESVHSD